MAITTKIVQTIFLLETISFSLLLIPLPNQLKKTVTTRTYTVLGSIRHVLIATYAMIMLLFLDSFYKYIQISSEIYHTDYFAELKYYKTFFDMYLTGFTLFLGLVYRRFSAAVMELYRAEEAANILRKQALGQKDYVAQIMEKNRLNEAEIKRLQDEIADEKKKVINNEVLMKQVEKNREEYFKLLKKYNEWKDSETKKTK
ncbi:Endoplasmic reticulum transmembrane protein 1 [Astathelohania contejeani]|uniref:Endoplasmic reticulum transmembrane protein n=1 Tax=Astathelohania contejeani TaxID=164912 RepID=A0ABQ7I2N3_9MICR|nr:Endoplasmic reticulum transmembrane protein 1 [Thelohania contejeani]